MAKLSLAFIGQMMQRDSRYCGMKKTGNIPLPNRPCQVAAKDLYVFFVLDQLSTGMLDHGFRPINTNNLRAKIKMADCLSDCTIAGAEIQHSNGFVPLPRKKIDQKAELLLPLGNDEVALLHEIIDFF